LFYDGKVQAVQVADLARGQAEHLMPMLETLLAEHGKSWSDLTRIGVGVGPGNFTGIRISVSAARGLALGLGIPAVGVSTLQAIHLLSPNTLAAVEAPRDMLYIQRPGEAPTMVPTGTANAPVFAPEARGLIDAMARCAAAADADVINRPKPLYIKPADAAPARDSAPVILS
jgi:tRNA A37 threonylcarbamoyladenosine modification protein TsaB